MRWEATRESVRHRSARPVPGGTRRDPRTRSVRATRRTGLLSGPASGTGGNPASGRVDGRGPPGREAAPVTDQPISLTISRYRSLVPERRPRTADPPSRGSVANAPPPAPTSRVAPPQVGPHQRSSGLLEIPAGQYEPRQALIHSTSCPASRGRWGLQPARPPAPSSWRQESRGPLRVPASSRWRGDLHGTLGVARDLEPKPPLGGRRTVRASPLRRRGSWFLAVSGRGPPRAASLPRPAIFMVAKTRDRLSSPRHPRRGWGSGAPLRACSSRVFEGERD